MDFAGQRVLVLGLAREGVSLARYLAREGAEVTVTDSAPADKLAPRLRALVDLPISAVVGGDHPELVADVDVLFVSPGVPESNPVYGAARAASIPIESMTRLFFDRCPGTIVGVTGSSGKTTTTGLIASILAQDGRKMLVGGNIGDPMLDLLPAIDGETTVVLELSSFQLDLLRASPHIAVVTNITPNHLDRHGTMEAYVAAKRNIVSHQTASDVAVLNASDPTAEEFAAATPAALRWFGRRGHENAATAGDVLGIRRGQEFLPVMSRDEIPLLGEHNVENVLAALATADALGVSPEAMKRGVRAYRPAPHRLEVVGERGGVRYVDDSIATSPARAMVALRAIEGPILLIAGGRDKRLPWEEFARLAVERLRAVFLIGEAAGQIEAALRQALRESQGTLSETMIVRCPSLEAAVHEASAHARPGDSVLLSPGCTSYDMFTDFDERGRVFAHIVEALHAA